MPWLALLIILPFLANTARSQQPSNDRFTLFFDWGKQEIRRDDAAILDQVAQIWRSQPSSRLQLIGHTDRSGDSRANRRSGLRRAEQVRDELAKRGVSRNAMTVASFGEERPLVPTEDGVREVQNRRVVIAIEE